MHMAIQRENGARAEAVLLASSHGRLRIAVSGRGDIEEWTMLDGIWRDESGGRIGIDALFAIDGVDCTYFSGVASARTIAMR